jgi:hypothetical protein
MPHSRRLPNRVAAVCSAASRVKYAPCSNRSPTWLSRPVRTSGIARSRSSSTAISEEPLATAAGSSTDGDCSLTEAAADPVRVPRASSKRGRCGPWGFEVGAEPTYKRTAPENGVCQRTSNLWLETCGPISTLRKARNQTMRLYRLRRVFRLRRSCGQAHRPVDTIPRNVLRTTADP